MNTIRRNGSRNQALLLLYLLPWLAQAAPLALHPANPHYFVYRGKPTVIITSGEHYGAVLNLDFDYAKYLKTLAQDGLNSTRTWAGAYCEPPSAFNISHNTLAPLPERFICPWARSNQPGYANGGNKFDLGQWDPAYFKRLKDFMSEARKRGVIVELNLFCPFYEESMWRLSPINALNNVNGIGAIARTNVYTLDRSEGVLEVQEEMVRKLVSELRGFENLYYEICNEPYFGGVALDWQQHIASIITDTERPLKAHHLISQNIANGRAKVQNPDPLVSIFNFHYASPPDAVGENYELNRVIGENETGFHGTNDAVYRMEAWDFIVAGGGLFNHLDYSFTTGHEDGTFVYPANQPGGGTASLRKELGFLSRVMKGLDFVHMRPDPDVVKAQLPPGTSIRALANHGKEYLLYLRTGLGRAKGAPNTRRTFDENERMVELNLPPGDYASEWLDTKTGRTIRQEEFHQARDPKVLHVPAFDDDIAAMVKVL
jgi:hypothetical protein